MLTRVFTMAERVGATALSFLASAILAAYAGDRVGLTIHPFAILTIAMAGAAIAFRSLGPRDDDGRAELIAFVGIAGAVFASLLWLARPRFLPPGSGSDLTHHLLLIDYIERTGRLVHDAALGAYLGEMMDYTAGFHLLAVLVGAWFWTDGLHALYTVVAVTVALKAGLVFVIARRLLPRKGAAIPVACVAALLLFLPWQYFVGSFTHSSFLAQVVSETFAVGMWWAMVAWKDEPTTAAAALFGLAGAATFLTWPVWVGALVLSSAVVVAARDGLSWRHRFTHAAIAGVPIGVAAVMHSAGRVGAAAIAAASGFVLRPTPATVGWPFLLLAAFGTIVAATDRKTRIVPLLLLAIAAQAAALFAVARAGHADTPYLALKMFYLAIYPLAVAAAIGLGLVARHLSRATLSAWVVALGLAAIVGRGIVASPQPRPVISDSLRDAGRWARSHVPPGCVDYLVDDDDTAYWLHLAVLGNPRADARARDSDTFEPDKALIRWVLPGGLPYAIAGDVDALPKDIRTSVDVLARFGPAAVVKRRGAASCIDDDQRKGR